MRYRRFRGFGMSTAHQPYTASLAAADEAHKERMKEALGARAAAVLTAQASRNVADSGDPVLKAALLAADFAHFEALRSSEAKRVDDRMVARAAFCQ
jgi:hypothetical protein